MEPWIWRLTGSRRLSTSIVATIGLLFICSVGLGPLVEWRQEPILERTQTMIDEPSDVDPPAPLPRQASSGGVTHSSRQAGI